METLLIMFWVFDIAALLCMVFVYFSQHHCSKVSLTFINIIPPSALAIASLVGGILPYPVAVLSAYLCGFIFFYAGNRYLIKKGGCRSLSTLQD